MSGEDKFINGAAFTFDAGEVVTPFFYFLHDTDVCDTVILQSFECGHQ